jgi:CHAT domain-containing protein
LAIRNRNLGALDELVVESTIGVASSLNELERSWDAEQLIKSTLALQIPSQGNWRGHVDLLHYLGYIYRLQKRVRDEENAYLDALKIVRQFTSDDDVATAQSLDHLADFYWGRNPARSQSLTVKSLDIQEQHGVLNTNQYIQRLIELARRYESSSSSLAETTLLKALHFGEQRLSEKDRDLSQIHMALSLYYDARKMTDKAIHHAREEARTAEVADGPQSVNFSNALSHLSDLLLREGQFREAGKLKRRACTLTAANFSYAPVISACWSNLADILANAGEPQEAYEVVTMAASQLRAHELAALRAGDRDAKELRKDFLGSPFAYTFLSQIDKGWRVFRGTNNSDLKNRIIGQSFEAAQWATRSRAADALNRTTARMTAISPELSDLARRIEMVTPAKEAAEAALVGEYNNADSTTERVDTLRAELALRQEEVDALALEIQRFPAYAALSNPAPLSVKAVQSLLGPNEVLVQLLIMDRSDTGLLSKESFVWVATRTDLRWVRSDFDAPALTREVAALRCGLDSSIWFSSPPRPEAIKNCLNLLGLQSGPVKRDPLPFDLQRAHALYKALFGQVEDLIKDKKLIVVPSGPLTSLPFSVLVTERPDAKLSKPEVYRDVAWLGVRQPITVLPSVASLQALRKYAKQSDAPNAFIGFGDPLLKGFLSNDPRAFNAQQCPAPEAPAPIVVQVAEVAEPAGEISSKYRGMLADVKQIERLQPLPETTKELCSVARQLGVPENDIASRVWLGSRATETNVKELSRKGELATYRVVQFATHALIAGEVKNLAESALVLTPPAEATEADDGLLTASEVTELKLNADWVVLSACNTAAGGAANAEALSGLARAFFYAGARSLLVSHWQVNSEAAVKLTTDAFTALEANPKIGRAGALQQAMTAMVKGGNPGQAHPANWAPFILVGEGGVAQ